MLNVPEKLHTKKLRVHGSEGRDLQFILILSLYKYSEACGQWNICDIQNLQKGQLNNLYLSSNFTERVQPLS